MNQIAQFLKSISFSIIALHKFEFNLKLHEPYDIFRWKLIKYIIIFQKIPSLIYLCAIIFNYETERYRVLSIKLFYFVHLKNEMIIILYPLKILIFFVSFPMISGSLFANYRELRYLQIVLYLVYTFVIYISNIIS